MTAAVGLWLLGCAGPRAAHYGTVNLVVPPIPPADADWMAGEVASGVGKRWLRRLELAPPVALEAAVAVWYTGIRANRGAELDLWIDAGRGPRAVTVWWTPDREARVEVGPRAADAPAFAAPPRSLDALELDWIGPWTHDEAGLVAAALSRLQPAERALLRGTPLHRDAESPRSPRRELATFVPTTDPPSLWFHDAAFGAQGFVGPVTAPVPGVAMTALHEVGHLIADLPYRRAYEAYVEAARAGEGREQRAAARATFRAYRALGGRGPVIDAWEAFRDGRRGPTPYGWREPRESFAEAFALWHLDPEALERALPGAGAWFAAGTHTAAAER